jgi:hypothetical protein
LATADTHGTSAAGLASRMIGHIFGDKIGDKIGCRD